jgi:hypothetical protein
VEVTRSRRRCHSLDEADWETRKEAPLTAWKEFSRVRFLRYGRDRVDLIVNFVASSYLVANWNRKSYSMQSLSRPPRPNGDRSYRGKWWPFPNPVGQRNERLPLSRCRSRVRDRTLFCNLFCFSIIHVITRVGLGPKITSSILTAEQQRRKEMSLAIDMKTIS